MSTTNITTAARTVLVAATIGVATLTVSACSDQPPQPPAQEINVELPEPEVRTFEPACNTRAAKRPCLDDPPAGSGIIPQR